jgi:hypothetical protein
METSMTNEQLDALYATLDREASYSALKAILMVAFGLAALIVGTMMVTAGAVVGCLIAGAGASVALFALVDCPYQAR